MGWHADLTSGSLTTGFIPSPSYSFSVCNLRRHLSAFVLNKDGGENVLFSENVLMPLLGSEHRQDSPRSARNWFATPITRRERK